MNDTQTSDFLLGNTAVNKTSTLDREIMELIKEEGTWLEGLLQFADKLNEDKEKLSPSQLTQAIQKIKSDIQNPDFLSFESGEKDGERFGFEGLGNDIIPVLSPNGDCIIPVNFWYKNQRRTILLVFAIQPDDPEQFYTLPKQENSYQVQFYDTTFDYELQEQDQKFIMHYNTSLPLKQ